MAAEKTATWQEVNTKVGSTGSPDNQCPTKSAIEATGKATVSNTYASNQLVSLADITNSWIQASYTCNMASPKGMTSISAVIDGTSTVVQSRLDSFTDGKQYFSLNPGALPLTTVVKVTFTFDIPTGNKLDNFGGSGNYTIVDRVTGYVITTLSSFDTNGVNIGSWQWKDVVSTSSKSFRVNNTASSGVIQDFKVYFTKAAYDLGYGDDTIGGGGGFGPGGYREGTANFLDSSLASGVSVYGVSINSTKTTNWGSYMSCSPSTVNNGTSLITINMFSVPS